MTAIIFGVAIFCGWLIFDIVKQRQFKLETVVSSFVVGVIGGVCWWLLEYVF